MTSIHWSGPSIREFETAPDFIAQDNRDAADRLAVAVYKAVSRLQRFPTSGRMAPDLEDPNLREVIQEPFRVIYQQRENVVEILAVVRAEREPDFMEVTGRSV